MLEIPQFDALFIRTTTDPRFPAYIASKLAWEAGLNVIDEPFAIIACSNKVHMYKLLQKANVPRIPTLFLLKDRLCHEEIKEAFDLLDSPIVLKAPYTAFSKYVEKAENEETLSKICKRFFRISDIVVAQKFLPTPFDWRIGILDNEILFACKYHIPAGKWKHGTRKKGGKSFVWGRTEAIKKETLTSRLREVAIQASKPFGRGLFGIDIKEISGEYVTVEVNDNATIYADEEDREDRDIYKRIITYLAQGKG
jgi:glutathione synthase/RimK-type ligase-like ATP-grasp enzyme